jgi:hypothetical protein
MNLPANWSDASEDAKNISWIGGLFNKVRPAMKPGVDAMLHGEQVSHQAWRPVRMARDWEQDLKWSIYVRGTHIFLACMGAI